MDNRNRFARPPHCRRRPDAAGHDLLLLEESEVDVIECESAEAAELVRRRRRQSWC